MWSNGQKTRGKEWRLKQEGASVRGEREKEGVRKIWLPLDQCSWCWPLHSLNLSSRIYCARVCVSMCVCMCVCVDMCVHVHVFGCVSGCACVNARHGCKSFHVEFTALHSHI